MAIRIYNTMTRRKEDFEPYVEGKVGMYCCGPTVYDYFHIGNARAFVVPDMVRKYLEFRGYNVTYVQNVTDIEDKIINRAKERGVTTDDIVRQYTKAFFEDRAALGVGAPDYQPRATEHVKDIISMVDGIIKKGHAYVSGGDVYFDVSSFAGYGKLSGQNPDDLKAGARVDISEHKDDPLDFVLWKGAKPGEPSWDSPWGPGRPGWHIECSVMSAGYLGGRVDIHLGGSDLVFPHHENEIAQSESFCEGEFVKYWMHNAMVNVEGERMGKSMGNFFTVRDILKKYPGKVVRYYLVASHYRQPISFGLDELDMCARALARLEDSIINAMKAMRLGSEDVSKSLEAATPEVNDIQANNLITAADSAISSFIDFMDDDFNTSGAMSALHELARAINAFIAEGSRGEESASAAAYAVGKLWRMGNVLGFMDDETLEADAAAALGEGEGLTGPLMGLVLKIRADARAKKDWALSDFIRDGLKELGITVEDTKDGARWKLERK